MAMWLLKTEPETYSWDQLVADGGTSWTGVRNHTARAHLAAMKQGDACLIYHSGGPRELVGLAEVTRAAYPDPTITAADPETKKGWIAVDIRARKPLARAVGLAEIKAHQALNELALVRQSRLSVSPVTPAQWRVLMKLGGA